MMSPGGEIGRHKGLKIPREKSRAGSSPALGTIAMKIILTGAAGFIGMHTAKIMLEKGYEVTGVDNLNDYYDVSLKKDRIKLLNNYKNFQFVKLDISDSKKVEDLVKKIKPFLLIHLAAQAGIRYSFKNPNAYIHSNIVGTNNIFEACRKSEIKNILFASSSSIYGKSERNYFSESDPIIIPESLYAATKQSNEMVANIYSKLYKMNIVGLRFFTVYGPWGRPDMAPFLFTDAIVNGRKIKVFNNGEMSRDFTFIDDISNSIYLLSQSKDLWSKNQNFQIFNIGNGKPVNLMNFIETIESNLGKKAKIEFEPMQPGDVPHTHASTDLLFNSINFRPIVSINEGIKIFIDWYKEYYKVD